MAETLPNFARDAASPKLEPGTGGIVIEAASGRLAETTLRGAFRVMASDRAELKSGPMRGQVWVVVIARDSRMCYLGRPGANAVVFEGEEPKTGAVEGWFNANLAECCGLTKNEAVLCDVTAIIGPYKSRPIEVKLRP